MNEYLKAILSIVSGGVLWEGFKFFYPDIKKILGYRIDAKNTLYENLDPILKSSDELLGKLESLAKEDFATYVNPSNSNSNSPKHNKRYIVYLFAQFWAQLEYLRLKSQYNSLAKIKKGKELLSFIDTIESRKFRILDRSIQRIIGQSLITNSNQKFKVMTLNEFMIEYEKPDSAIAIWGKKLEDTLQSVDDKKNRQTILLFGVIISMLINHFDPKHKSVRKRVVYKSKLSQRSKKIIKNRLLNQYLKFIKSKEEYY
ncbi:MAG: hypothetical protein WC140_05145 [Bacteroidales bacterium]